MFTGTSDPPDFSVLKTTTGRLHSLSGSSARSTGSDFSDFCSHTQQEFIVCSFSVLCSFDNFPIVQLQNAAKSRLGDTFKILKTTLYFCILLQLDRKLVNPAEKLRRRVFLFSFWLF